VCSALLSALLSICDQGIAEEQPVQLMLSTLRKLAKDEKELKAECMQ